MNQQIMQFNKKSTVMKKGSLQIRMDSTNTPKVKFCLHNDTIWLNKNELCELYGCYMKDIDKYLEEIFKKEMFRIEDTCHYHIIAGNKRISYEVTEVNLTVIISLAFMMKTPQAGILRSWFIEQVIKNKALNMPIVDIGENFLLN